MQTSIVLMKKEKPVQETSEQFVYEHHNFYMELLKELNK